jgi:predicted Zn-dependent peptidase
MFELGGAFDRDRAIPGMKALLDALRAVRGGAISAEALDTAKRSFVASWRSIIETNSGVAGLLAQAIENGESPETVLDLDACTRAVTLEQVLAVARRYLGEDALRVVLVGSPHDLGPARMLGFGKPAPADGYGHLIPQ